MKEILRCDSRGSVLVVTTRSKIIADMMATIDAHCIDKLTQVDSWTLFKQKASSTAEVEEHLVAIGKKMVEKCDGVPLAIKALGSLMRSKRRKSEWIAIEECEMWKVLDGENGILPILRLSYDNLLPHMQQCFAYCCLFPKDEQMEVKELIQLWMANGLVHSDGQSDLFDVGRSIWEELVSRCFFEDIQVHYAGERTCRMHDLMHDLAESIMRHETYILQDGKEQQIPKSVRHLSLSTQFYRDIESTAKLQIDCSLRSHIIREEGSETIQLEAVSSFISKQQFIRALKMDELAYKKFPNWVCKLKHLKYLCMSCWQLKSLPESLTRLYNLQTWKLSNSSHLVELPKGLKKMKNLWFLEMEFFYSLISTPPGLGELTCLRRLSVFIVGEGALQRIDQLRELNNLSGELSIKRLNTVRNLEEVKSANLKEKNLTSLSLYWSNDYPIDAPQPEEVLRFLEPSDQNLESIHIYGYRGYKFPNWMSTLVFEKLEEIWLVCCSLCEYLPPLGKLRYLRRIQVVGMALKSLGDEWHGDAQTSFPALAELEISDMPNLEEWCIPDSIESFPCLSHLVVESCPKLDRFPFLRYLRDLITEGNNLALVSSATRFTSLKSLTIRHSAEVGVFAGTSTQRLTTLENLKIVGQNIRTVLDILGSLPCLKTLCFKECSSNPEFHVDGLKGLDSLESLSFRWCDALTSFHASVLEDLPSLRTLELFYCTRLKLISGPLNKETSLQCLKMEGLEELECVPEIIQQFDSLSELSISDCGKLKSLPDGFRSLKSLQKLRISLCPELEKRCMKAKGKDWPKISHIPFIEIHYRVIQNLDKRAR